MSEIIRNKIKKGILHKFNSDITTSTGGIIYDYNGYRIHVFLSDGIFIPSFTNNVEVFLVAAGGGIASSNEWVGGSGAGGALNSTINVVRNSRINITVGQPGFPAGNSTFENLIAYGGGLGVSQYGTGFNGGSGGGSTRQSSIVGSGVSGQGHDGNYVGSVNNRTGGGGGASGAGYQSTSNGGAGINWSSYLGTDYGVSGWFAGGGAGYGGTATHGGGNPGIDGTIYSGGGGGGCGQFPSSGNGGSGIVFVRYLIPEGY